jgi:TonB dependent receptor/TonB-dependent Receptor Plug Domain
MHLRPVTVGLLYVGQLLAPAVAADALAGRRVADILVQESSPTLRFLYSSQLVPDALRVLHEPSSTAPLALAREILAPHHLTLVPLAPGIYAVATETPATRAANAVAAALSISSTPAPSEAEATLTPAFETQITGERYPYGLKLADDSQLFSAARLGVQPSLGEDVMYALARQPGLSQDDLSGRLNIRGGLANETLILFDGFPIREAYHMPNYRGVLSVFDPSSIREVSLYTGAMPARYGDRLSGVIEFRSIDGSEPLRMSLGAGFLNARARTVQTIGADGGEVLVAVRYGAMGYLLNALEPATGNPRYGDALGRLGWRIGASTEVSINALYARDELFVERNGLQETSRQKSSVGYFWGHSTTTLDIGSGDARLNLWLGHSLIDTQRSGALDQAGFAAGDLYEHRRAQMWDLRAELQWSPGDTHVLETGLWASHGNATYQYHSDVQYAPGVGSSLGVPDSNSQAYELAPRRTWGSLYASDTWLLWPGISAQLGLRVTRYDSPDDDPLTAWDPRVMLSWQATPTSTLRAGWSRVHQVSSLSEIVPGRDPLGRLVGEASEYIVAGIDHTLDHQMLLRVEAFREEQLHLLPLQRNLLLTPSILPELSLDRFWSAPRDARIRGLEFTIQQSSQHWHRATAFALTDASESYASGRRARSGIPRQAASMTLDWTAGQWLLGSALNCRSGLPTTAFAPNSDGGLVIGQCNAARLPATLGFDLRLSWQRSISGGLFRATAQVSNLFGGDSSCCSELAPVPGTSPPILRLHKDGALPSVPWIGVSWDL